MEGFLTQNQESWIAAHNHAFAHFGGVTKILVPDNLKTGVEQSSWYTPVIDQTYHEMAEHYGTAVIPARVQKLKDKPGVEGTVGNISTWILAALRNQTFFSLTELNAAIAEKLARHQHTSTIFISKFSPGGWHEKIGEHTMADTILDRIVHNSYQILIDGEASMRKRISSIQ